MSLDAGDRKYIKLTALFFGLLALVGLGAALYRPLRLRYAMYRVERDYPLDPDPQSYPEYPNEWLWLCVHAAEQGNPRAMELVCNRYWVRFPVSPAPSGFAGSIAFDAAKAQPQVFLSVLDRKDDREVIAMLAGVQMSVSDDGGFPYIPIDNDELRALVTRFDESTHSYDPAEAQLAAAVSEYLRRRFAKELAETEKEKPE